MYHPNLSRNKEVMIHLAFWLIWAYFGLVVIGRDGIGFARMELFSWTWVLVYAGTFYFHYLVILPHAFQPFSWVRLVAGSVLSLLFFCSLRYLIEQFLTLHLFGVQNYAPGTGLFYYLHDNLFYASYPVILSSILWGALFVVRLLAYNKRILEENKNAEIRFLKAQINPHVVFNTLNNIYSMVYFRSENALPAIHQLSQIMRFTTYQAQQERIKLADELGYIQAYIDLEKLRHQGDGLVILEIPADFENIEIPPCILSPLVENAFKHRPIPDATPVSIRLKLEAHQLVFSVENQIGTAMKDHLGGIGLANLRHRLDIYYPRHHVLRATRENNRFIASLQLDLG